MAAVLWVPPQRHMQQRGERFNNRPGYSLEQTCQRFSDGLPNSIRSSRAGHIPQTASVRRSTNARNSSSLHPGSSGSYSRYGCHSSLSPYFRSCIPRYATAGHFYSLPSCSCRHHFAGPFCRATSSGAEPLTAGRGIGIVGSSTRGIRGGNWNNNSNNLANENNNIGFRVASPGTLRRCCSLLGPESLGSHFGASATVPTQGLPGSPGHRRACRWANKVDVRSWQVASANGAAVR